MTYPELAALDSTPDQDLALTIEWKTLVNANATTTKSPSAYLAERVGAVLDDLRLQRVVAVQTARVLHVVTADVSAAASALNVDLTIDVPADVKADEAVAVKP